MTSTFLSTALDETSPVFLDIVVIVGGDGDTGSPPFVVAISLVISLRTDGMCLIWDIRGLAIDLTLLMMTLL